MAEESATGTISPIGTVPVAVVGSGSRSYRHEGGKLDGSGMTCSVSG